MTEQDTLKKLWASLLPTVPIPDAAQFTLWLAWHDIETVKYGIIHAAKKNLKMGCCMNLARAAAFASACMNYNHCPARQREAALRRRIEEASIESEGHI